MLPWQGRTLFLEILGSSDLVKVRNKRRGNVEVRFIADAVKKCVYVWDAYNKNHNDASKVLKPFIQGDYFNIDLFFTGTANMEGTSLTYAHSDFMDSELGTKKKAPSKTGMKIIDNKDRYAQLYAFADQYIDGISTFFSSLK